MRPFVWILSFILLSGFVFGITLKKENPNKDKLLLEIISYVLDRGHFDPKDINDVFSENAYMSYLENIDGQHRFFLKSDINSFNFYRHLIDDEIKNTQVEFFNLSFEKLMERMSQVEGFYKSLLETPFDFSIKDEINLDFKKASYANNLTELRSIWRKRLKLNALERFTSKKDEEVQKLEIDVSYVMKTDSELEVKAREIISENMDSFFERYNDLNRKDWFSIYINSIVLQFDPHTSYLAPNDKDRFDASMSGEFEGIGARLQKRNQEVKIVEVISGGPVWRDELLEIGDIILKVAQPNKEAVDISGMRLDDSIKLIKGPKGTQVILTIKRVDGSIEDVKVTRDVVILEETYARSSLITNDKESFGLIELPKFYVNFQDYNQRNAATDVKKKKFPSKKHSY